MPATTPPMMPGETLCDVLWEVRDWDVVGIPGSDIVIDGDRLLYHEC